MGHQRREAWVGDFPVSLEFWLNVAESVGVVAFFFVLGVPCHLLHPVCFCLLAVFASIFKVLVLQFEDKRR